MDNRINGPQGAAVDHHGSLERAIEHARSLAGSHTASPGVLGPDGAEIWLRFCRNAGLGSGDPHN